MKALFNIEGMHCGSCASRIENALGKAPGVRFANINFATKKGVVEGDISREHIKELIEDMGYAVAFTGAPPALEMLSFKVEGMNCGSCASRISHALERAPGVAAANVNFATKRATVSGSARREDIERLLEELGYHAVFADGPNSLVDKGQAPVEETLDTERAEAARRLKSQGLSAVVSLLLALAVMAIGMSGFTFEGKGLLLWLLTSVVVLVYGRGFFSRAFSLLRAGSANMDTLVALGSGAAYLYSVALLRTGAHHDYFESAALIVAFVLFGRYLEERARNRATSAIFALASLQPQKAKLVRADGSEAYVPVASLRQGDLFVVAPGDKVATDGEVVEGESALDESLLTGESLPVLRRPDDEVIGATLNVGRSRLIVRATKVGADTALAQIINLVEEAQNTKTKAQRLADRVALYFVPFVLVVAFFTFLGWSLWGVSLFAALVPAVAVLVIACPCALGLATPTAVVAGTGRAAQRHILIRSAGTLEEARRLKTIVLDKTGTLTEGRPVVVRSDLAPGWQSHIASEALLYGALFAAESVSRHPLARAIAGYCEAQPHELQVLVDFEEFSGQGVRASTVFRQHQYSFLVGSREFLVNNGVMVPESWRAIEASHAILVYVAVDMSAVAILEIEDPLRTSAVAAAATLRDMGIRVIMATGDRGEVANYIGKQAGITEIHANLRPQDKLALLDKLKAEAAGAYAIGMVGDGINDAPALAEADVSFAVGSGTDVAIAAADVVLPHGDLGKVVEAIRISQATVRVIKQNLFWAFVYNLVALPIAAAGLLSPMLAAGAMALSSVFVVSNSLRLRRAGVGVGTT